MLQQWDKRFPGRLETMFRSIQNVKQSHLADTTCFDFKGLKTQQTPFINGDTAFDEETFDQPIEAMMVSLAERSAN